MQARTLLFVLDEPEPDQVLTHGLQALGFHLVYARDGEEALTMLASLPVVLVMVDMVRPEDASLVCQRVRLASNLPVIMITEESCEEELVTYMEARAHDCLVKPVRLPELSARVRAVFDKITGPLPAAPAPVLRCGDIEVHVQRRRVYKAGQTVQISATGFRLLMYFLLHQGELVTKLDLLRRVWGYTEFSGDTNLVDSAISRLRKDMGEDPAHPGCLHTVWGQGYRFEARENNAGRIVE